MSKYTTEVRFICENYAGLTESVGYSDIEKILDESWEKVFDFEFPIFDNDYKSVLCRKILKHYYTREIGFETVGLWKLKLNMMMNEIMPYYNKLYESELLKFNPLYDADYSKTHEGKDGGEGSENGSHTGTVGDAGTHTGTVRDQGSREGNIDDVGNEQLSETTWDVYSDTPQGALTNVDNNTYLTNARKISHDAETDTTNNRDYDEQNENLRTYNESQGNTRTYNERTGVEREYTNTNQYVEHIIGKFPGRSYATMLKEFRETFLNIDVDVIADLSDLFIKLW